MADSPNAVARERRPGKGKMPNLGRKGPRKLVTQADVAHETGYSVVAVSHVLRGLTTGMSPEAALRIREAARRLGYVYAPNKRRKDARGVYCRG